MIFAIDYDGSVISGSPPRLAPGCREALLALKKAGHTLLLFSSRNNRARRFNQNLDPLIAAGVTRAVQDPKTLERLQHYSQAMYRHMTKVVNQHLPGVF